jgi:orotate phosphoribosyltransferase
MGALPFASIVADKLQLPLVYPDMAFDESGIVLRRGFDKFIKDKTVFILEDIVTTGGSFQDLFLTIANHGGSVVGTACIWNRGDIEIDDKLFSAIINKQIISHPSNSCPLCDQGIPLTDPKTNKVIA